MSLSSPKRTLDQGVNPPKPSAESFAGRTILLTGASSGLGLAAAKKIAALNADRLIITARTESKGQATKRQIEAFVKTDAGVESVKPTEIIPMVLSMDAFGAVQEFAVKLRADYPDGIDGAILNAGMISANWVQSPDGWEETFQVNSLSSFLLGILILPLLIARVDSGRNTGYKPHLTFISSGTAWRVKPEQMKAFIASETPLAELNLQKNFPGGLVGGAAQYARSKLVLEYAVRHLAASPLIQGPDGKPKVIVNTVCPGMCKSDLGRNMAEGSLLLRIVQRLVNLTIARTAEDGANTYIAALERGDETHGEMWKNDRVFETGPMMTTEEGKHFGEKLWREIVQVVLKADVSTKPFLG